MIHLPVLIVILPLFGAVVMPLLPKRKPILVAWTSLIFSTLALLALISFQHVNTYGAFHYVFGNYDAAIGIEFFIDPLLAFLVLFVAGLASLIILFSFEDIPHELKEHQYSHYYSLIMLLMFSMLGMIYTNDLFNTYVFMEILSITSTAIISIKHKRANFLASFRYLMLSSIGSLTILLGLAFLYMVTGQLNMDAMARVIQEVWVLYPTNLVLAVGFMLIGLAIKSAMFPLHIWLPDAHSSAPSPSSAFLSSLVVKVYIVVMIKLLYRIIGTEIIAALNIDTFILTMAGFGMIFGSVFAIGQRDIKRLLAYSSVAQIAYIFLGIGLLSRAGLAAGLFHIVSHALMKSALFLSAGAIIYGVHERRLAKLDGIGFRMPITMIVFTLAALGMIGIPGISGFMSKIYLGIALIEQQHPIFLSLILLSSFLNAIYYMPILISAFLKEDILQKNQLSRDPLPNSMIIAMVVIALALVVVGLYPQIIMNIIEKAMPYYF
jgi:multicomponent Na+:H+ antiporter subunit D